MCVEENVCDDTEQGMRQLHNYAHIHAHVFILCCVLMFLWILAFTLSLVSDVSTFIVNCISPRIRNTKCRVFFLLDVVVRLCPVIVHLICIPNSCIFHIAKKGLLRCCLYIVRYHLQIPELLLTPSTTISSTSTFRAIYSNSFGSATHSSSSIFALRCAFFASTNTRFTSVCV